MTDTIITTEVKKITTKKDLQMAYDDFIKAYPQWVGQIKIVYGADAYYGRDLVEYLNSHSEFENSESFHQLPYDSGNEGLFFEGSENDIEKISKIAKKEPYFKNGDFYIIKHISYPDGFISFAQENSDDCDLLLNREFVKKI